MNLGEQKRPIANNLGVIKGFLEMKRVTKVLGERTGVPILLTFTVPVYTEIEQVSTT